MKTLHINTNYLTTALHQLLIRELTCTGIENIVFVPTNNIHESIINIDSNVILSECFGKWDRVFFQYKSRKIFNSIDKQVNIINFDVIHAYTLFTDGNVAWNLYKKYNIPYIVAIRDTDVNVFLKYMIHLRNKGIQIMLDAYAVIFLSESYKSKVFKDYIPKKYRKNIISKSIVIPNGIDDFWFKNLYNKKISKSISNRLKNNIIKILYVGRINRRKNIGLTLKAIDYLISEGWKIKFDIIGNIENINEYNNIINKDYTIYHKTMKKEQLLDFYRESDIFVMPSHTETFGLAYAEAISQDLPVIYTKGEGFDGQFKDGIVGYSVNDTNSQELANTIKKIVRNYNQIVPIEKRILDKFSWKNIANTYSEIYHKAALSKIQINQ